ncbi:MAG: excinuclease ABC subunit B [Saprospiraceae bacterium]|jgi:excinuclease ABC subunit B
MSKQFELISEYSPKGDQPEAIKQLVQGIKDDVPHQTLLGVTGSGKTFTMANVIKEINRPTLILSHNKTLAAQLYNEFKQYFPNNAVEYFVSYYDYYQPEAFLPVTGTYIEKDLSINKEIEKLRLRATSTLLSGRSDVIIVSSVSCIYGMGNPADFEASILEFNEGMAVTRTKFLRSLVDSLYSRTEMDFERGNFRVKGDTIDLFPGHADYAIRFSFWGDEIESIHKIDPEKGTTIERLEYIKVFPANLFVTSKERMTDSLFDIQKDLEAQYQFFMEEGKVEEAKRLKDRVEQDLEMIRELGYCSGIENYSRYLDGRNPGERPFCLMDYFPDDFLMMIDESHVTIGQVKAMYGGDRSRKINLVDYGFRLPAAMDNRPLKFEEFETILNQVLYVSATPADYELELSEGIIVEQVIRPTGLLDPKIEVRPTKNQVDDLLHEIQIEIKKGNRILVTTLTKRMAEELSKYIANVNISCTYMHSEIDTMDRVEILSKLRSGVIDVLVGVNLLREGLDLPEVSLVVIMDADKEGFLRSERSLTQTVGRAARNLEGRVIMYGDKVTDSMRKTMDETDRRRKIQQDYNDEHGITPTAIIKKQGSAFQKNSYTELDDALQRIEEEKKNYSSKKELLKLIRNTKANMEKSAKEYDFLNAAKFRDLLKYYQEEDKK